MVGAAHLAQTLGQPDVIATDVGGTTFKVALIRGGEWGYSRETVLNQYQLRLPMIDVASIGAGGGSIAWVDGARLRVGPRSAAAEPGPACYGLGGTEPTVTDADLVLGYLSPDRFLGGRMALHPSARARRSPGESRRRSSTATCSPPRPASGKSSTARWRTSSARSRSNAATTRATSL